MQEQCLFTNVVCTLRLMSLWSMLCFFCYVEVIQCVSEVDESGKTALLDCSKLDYNVEDVVCVLPSETIDCK